MSPLNKRKLIVLGAGLSATITLGAALGFLMAGRHVQRTPASVNPMKSASFKPSQLRISKPNQILEAQIEVIEGFPTTNSEEAKLRAHIKINRNVDSNVAYEWTFPPGVTLVSGSVRGLLSMTNLNQEQVVEISVKGFSSEGLPRNILLDLSAVTAGIEIGSNTVINSHPTRSDLTIGFRQNQKELDEERHEKMMNSNSDESETEPSALDKAQPPKGIKL